MSSNLFRNLLYVSLSQIVVIITGVVKALVVPVVLGVAEFGYWQIYVFYIAYIGFFTLGYIDGVYLKYGGRSFDSLPLTVIRASNLVYVQLLFCLAVAIVAVAESDSNPNRTVVFYGVAANILVLGTISKISMTIQAANQMKGYAYLNSADKIFFTLALLALISESYRSFSYLILADVASKAIVLGFLVYRFRQLFFGPMATIIDGLKEFSSNVGSGAFLMLANVSGMMVLGIGRITVEYFGAIESYSHYAYTITLTNLILMFVAALTIVVYPALAGRERGQYQNFFNVMTSGYFALAVLLLAGYFPVIAFVRVVATDYEPVIEFLNVMFVVMVLQGKMQLINNTYYKVLRLERQMLVANMSSFALATCLVALAYACTHSLLAIAYATMITMIWRVYSSELFLRRFLDERFRMRCLGELATYGLFLVITALAPPMLAMLIWISVTVWTLVSKRKSLLNLYLAFRGLSA